MSEFAQGDLFPNIILVFCAAHISPCDLSVDVGRHVVTAVLLLQLSLVGVQPLLQGAAVLLELLRQRQSFFQILLSLFYL